ncbi:MAG: DUF1330 domain-containing protein [Sphingomonadales bacterium]|nr:MAG: DUF1330 domain-containing protein [Sphingomonadales bacterium]
MPAYFVAVRNSTRDNAEMTAYSQKAGGSMAGHRLNPLAVYGKIRSTDGPPTEGAVIIEFPTFEEAEAWFDSPAYQDALQHRLKGADYQTFILDGI